MTNYCDSRLPVTLLTGFLGSGKTTVLNQLLARPELADTAVIINEFGEIGIDHLLVEAVDENLRVLNSGCLCCTVRSDLIDTLCRLWVRRDRHEIPPFRRVLIETTGLADPAPVLHTLMVDRELVDYYRLDAVVTTVDALNGEATLRNHPESIKQVAVADRLLLTKSDLVEPHVVANLSMRVKKINPTASVQRISHGNIGAVDMFGFEAFDPLRKSDDVRSWLEQEKQRDLALQHGSSVHHHHDEPSRHEGRIRTHCVILDEPLEEAAFTHWLDVMAAMRGDNLLRVKGFVQLAEHPDEPLVVHGVQHVFHPNRRLAAWPSSDRRTRLVFITNDLPLDQIVRTFEKFAGATPNIARAL